MLLPLFFIFLESLVKNTDSLDAVLGFLLGRELKTHFDLLEILALVGKLVVDARIAVVVVQDHVLVAVRNISRQVCGQLFLLLQMAEVLLIVVAEPRYAEVERDDLGAALSARDLDEVVHEEPALDRLVKLAQANGRELGNYNRSNLRAGYWNWAEDWHTDIF